ncbi:MAG: hypothetical protein R3B91_03220 [Planctomycetaceae bacterium]
MIRATIIGFVLGATIPIAYGIYIIDRTHSYWESFANDPNTGFCGMPIVGAWVIIFAGGPIGAMCGAMIGRIGARSIVNFLMRTLIVLATLPKLRQQMGNESHRRVAGAGDEVEAPEGRSFNTRCPEHTHRGFPLTSVQPGHPGAN